MNGQGKTNLLEAIYYAATTRSFRMSSARDLIKQGQKQAYLELEFKANSIEHNIKIELIPGTKKLTFDGKKLFRASNYSGHIIPFVYSKDIIFLFNSSNQYRRKFFDRFISLYFPEYLFLMQESKKIRQQKLILLKTNQKMLELSTYNNLLSENVIAINKIRAEFCLKLNEALRLNDNIWALNYKPSVTATTPAEAEKLFEAKLSQEMHRRILLLGNQLDRYELKKIGVSKSRLYSSGEYNQQYYLLLFALYSLLQKHNSLHIFLIDDIINDIDHNKTKDLIRFLNEAQAQVFLTSTTPLKQFQNDVKTFMVEAGTCKL